MSISRKILWAFQIWPPFWPLRPHISSQPQSFLSLFEQFFGWTLAPSKTLWFFRLQVSFRGRGSTYFLTFRNVLITPTLFWNFTDLVTTTTWSLMVVWIDIFDFLSDQRKNRLVIIFGEFFVSWHQLSWRLGRAHAMSSENNNKVEIQLKNKWIRKQ